MSRDFPFLIGRIALTSNWLLHLPLAFKQRMEDGAMVLWRPGFTIWLNAWNNNTGQSIANRKTRVANSASPEKFDEREHEDGGRFYYSYRLAEHADDERVAALYAFSFADDGHLQLSFYFDGEDDAELAYEILASANDKSPSLPDHRIYSQVCFVTNLVISDGHAVGYMYREEPDSADDSGWRFFSGGETQEYVDDPANTQLCPVALVAQSTPDIIPYLLAAPGSQLERNGDKFVPCEERI